MILKVFGYVLLCGLFREILIASSLGGHIDVVHAHFVVVLVLRVQALSLVHALGLRALRLLDVFEAFIVSVDVGGPQLNVMRLVLPDVVLGAAPHMQWSLCLCEHLLLALLHQLAAAGKVCLTQAIDLVYFISDAHDIDEVSGAAGSLLTRPPEHVDGTVLGANINHAVLVRKDVADVVSDGFRPLHGCHRLFRHLWCYIQSRLEEICHLDHVWLAYLTAIPRLAFALVLLPGGTFDLFVVRFEGGRWVVVDRVVDNAEEFLLELVHALFAAKRVLATGLDASDRLRFGNDEFARWWLLRFLLNADAHKVLANDDGSIQTIS